MEQGTLNAIAIFGAAGVFAIGGIIAAAFLTNPTTEYMGGSWTM